MSIVTDVLSAPGKSGLVEVIVDGLSIGAIAEHDVARLGLRRGGAIEESQVAELRVLAAHADALRRAQRFLMHRPRTTQEVRRRLVQAGIAVEVIDAVIETLTSQGLLDDKQFAALWVENRTALRPRSTRMLQQELRQKGIDRDTIDDTIETTLDDDEGARAMAAGRGRLHRLRNDDRQSFDRSMGGFLSRRGFSYDVIRTALEQLWSEHTGEI